MEQLVSNKEHQVAIIRNILSKPEKKQDTLASYGIDEKIKAIINWKSELNKRTFDLSYIESLREDYIRFGSLSDAQEDALDNIIRRFRIIVSNWV